MILDQPVALETSDDAGTHKLALVSWFNVLQVRVVFQSSRDLPDTEVR